MSVTQLNQKQKPRRPRFLRFSLRGLLLLFTLLPIGMWYWWQRPFEIEVVIDKQAASLPPAHLERWLPVLYPGEVEDPFVIYAAPAPPSATGKGQQIGYYRREARTVRRTGWNDLLRHGRTLVYNKAGRKIFEETWRDDQLHGPYRMWTSTGQLIARGEFHRSEKHGHWTIWNPLSGLNEEQEYQQGKPIGVWIWYQYGGKKLWEKWYENGNVVKSKHYSATSIRTETFNAHGRRTLVTVHSLDGRIELERTEYRDGIPHGISFVRRPNGKKKRESHYSDGQPLGKWRWWNEDGEVSRTMDFEGGFLVRLNDEPIKGFTKRLANAPIKIRQALATVTRVTYIGAALPDIADFLADRHHIPLGIHRHRLAATGDLVRKISRDSEGTPLCLQLLSLLGESKLVCDYRYQQVLITTEDDARTWTDRTGVRELQPPAGSSWDRALTAVAGSEFDQLSPMKISAVAKQLGVVILIDPELEGVLNNNWRLSVDDRPRSLRERLWILLGRENLTCEFDGDTLFIKPLEDGK